MAHERAAVAEDQVDHQRAEERQADYEKAYRQYKDLPQPRIASIRADVDIFPEQRRVDIRGHYRLENRTAAPIAELHVSTNTDVDVRKLEFGAHTVVKKDDVHGYAIYRLATPLAPGASLDFAFELSSAPHGFPMNGGGTFTVIDSRSEAAYDDAHIPGALCLRRVGIDALPDGPLVVYCWGPGCNGAVKACAALVAAGRSQVKEMLGGFEYWVREGFALEGERATSHEPDLSGLVCSVPA